MSSATINPASGLSRRRIASVGANVTNTLQRRGVRIPEFAIGLLIVSVCVIGAFLWQNSGTSGTPVLVTARNLERGHEIQASDLETITVTSSANIALLQASTATDVVGMRMVNDIATGSPLTPSQLTGIDPLAVGEGLVGITVTKSQAPIDLFPGDEVRLIAVDSQSDGSNLSSTIRAKVGVWDISEPDELSGDRSVTLRIDLAATEEIVGHDELHLVKVVG